MQMSFLPKIDRKATQKRIEGVLDTARIYRRIGFERREVRNTPSYEPRFHGQTNATSDQVGDNASWNVDAEERIRELTERVERAVKRLPKRQRQIIEMRYLNDDVDRNFDYMVYTELNISSRTYDREKARAIYSLAFMLRMEVIEKNEEPLTV
ncbi:ArpU family phage packaging/lysis transcriptional regulator [Aneurinibacillus thermoaerophilus]|jgi:ArpU family phage transcriptional regulator|uniref:ArpU family transcriptional regulator n=1 Tax=Aneurinibacillus thermoaerophilus TaxID=143495 RepID=A0ABX8Y731_ANETH|nr:MULTISPECIES: ArpU family phage packaging/lysis transcriptional regulator [Aneurinibacillus]AMA72756.1 ArpU family transcriptional regulator [Aneurinibacillus sp. XH2]QYY41483.1 ArpU family transcriptional regulator [Aneurinibacillus thermoaerophilus]